MTSTSLDFVLSPVENPKPIGNKLFSLPLVTIFDMVRQWLTFNDVLNFSSVNKRMLRERRQPDSLWYHWIWDHLNLTRITYVPAVTSVDVYDPTKVTEQELAFHQLVSGDRYDYDNTKVKAIKLCWLLDLEYFSKEQQKYLPRPTVYHYYRADPGQLLSVKRRYGAIDLPFFDDYRDHFSVHNHANGDLVDICKDDILRISRKMLRGNRWKMIHYLQQKLYKRFMQTEKSHQAYIVKRDIAKLSGLDTQDMLTLKHILHTDKEALTDFLAQYRGENKTPDLDYSHHQSGNWLPDAKPFSSKFQRCPRVKNPLMVESFGFNRDRYRNNRLRFMTNEFTTDEEGVSDVEDW